jgi:hypothetical protein
MKPKNKNLFEVISQQTPLRFREENSDSPKSETVDSGIYMSIQLCNPGFYPVLSRDFPA